MNATFKKRTRVDRDVGGGYVRVRVQLLVQKAADEGGELRLLDM